MRYDLDIVDTFDRDSLTYEIWDKDKLIAEVYMGDSNDMILTCFKQEEQKIFFKDFFNILKKIEKEISHS